MCVCVCVCVCVSLCIVVDLQTSVPPPSLDCTSFTEDMLLSHSQFLVEQVSERRMNLTCKLNTTELKREASF